MWILKNFVRGIPEHLTTFSMIFTKLILVVIEREKPGQEKIQRWVTQMIEGKKLLLIVWTHSSACHKDDLRQREEIIRNL